MRVAIIGATGEVGRILLKLLYERGFPVDELGLFASEQSAGRELAFGRQIVPVQPLSSRATRSFDLAFCTATDDVSHEWVPRFNDAGACVIDLTGVRRMSPGVPLVIPEVNPEALAYHDGIIASPNCATIQMLIALKPIYDAVGITRIIVCSMQSVSGAGTGAITDLKHQARAVLNGMNANPSECLTQRIAFNAVPEVGGFLADSPWTNEELKLMDETKKILRGGNGIRISPTCVRIPVEIGHSQDITVETTHRIEADACRELLEAAPSVVVQDAPEESFYPMAINVTDSDSVFVGRIRNDTTRRTLKLWVVANNLRKGSATNALQIAEELVQQGLVHP